MPVLSNIQADFARAIIFGVDLSPQTLGFCPKYPVVTAMAIYRNNYRGNLHDTLVSAYPVIEQLVGTDFFRFLAKQFIFQHSSSSGNLHHYGAEMARFVADFEPAQGLIYLPDIAALEWACHRAYFADDAGILDIRRLSQITPEHYADLVLHTHPACHVVRSNYPITAIWNAHQPGANCDFHISLDSGPSNALVSRMNNSIIVSELEEADATWLQHIQSGISLGEATANTLKRHPEFDLNAALVQLVGRGILTDFTLENSQ